jgi:hypothetical protein
MPRDWSFNNVTETFSPLPVVERILKFLTQFSSYPLTIDVTLICLSNREWAM